jgi:hypothetical protein
VNSENRKITFITKSLYQVKQKNTTWPKFALRWRKNLFVQRSLLPTEEGILVAKY